MRKIGSALRPVLDGLYLGGGVIAAFFLVAILFVIVAQMVSRWTGILFPGSSNYAGYAMAGASFFAFAYALNHGAHIRVSLLLNRLGGYRYYGEIWCFAIGSLVSVYFTYYAMRAVYWSYRLRDVSQGQDATPLWIPQLVMAAGTTLLAIAFLDHLIRLIFLGSHGIKTDVVDQSRAE